jgi:hypothetical protein
MNLLGSEPLYARWDRYRQRPFWRLVELFLARIFRGGGDTDAEGVDLGIGLVLTLLAMPGGFVSILLFNKYGSLLQWLRGEKNVDTLAIAFPDEYFFIVLSMTVTAAVAVWRWDSIFPDRRDSINLVHLPISTRTIFLSNLVAVLLLVGLVALDVNAASCVLFPMVVSASQSKFLFFLKFAQVHAFGVILSGIFAFFAVFCLLGLLMALVPPPALKRVSAYIRGAIVVYLVALLCTAFAVPGLLGRARGPVPFWTLFLPSCWFVSLCQSLRGRATPVMAELARLTLPGIAALALITFATYVIGYRRHFVRIAEIAEGGKPTRNPARSQLAGGIDKLVLRTPFQKGCFRFVGKTMLRSESHRLLMTADCGLALVLVSGALMDAFQGRTSARQAALTPDALSIPFILSFLIAIGLRLVFELPAELRANWIFQLTLDRNRQESAPLARKVILLTVLPLALAVTFPVYFYLQGFAIASLHSLFAMTWTMLLTDLLLIRFRKVPFTCSPPVFKQHSIVILLAFCFGYLLYAVSIPEFESSALIDPIRMLNILPLMIVVWYVPRYLANNTIEPDRKLLFEETASRTVELLRLSE